MKFVSVSGPSMHPYLQDGDLLGFEECSKSALSLGDLALVRVLPEDRLLVHRHLGAGRIKGDRNLGFDDDFYDTVEVLGRITGRVSVRSRGRMSERQPESTVQPLGGGVVRSLQVKLSRSNHLQQQPLWRRVCVAMLIVMGWIARAKEDFKGTL